MKPATVSHVKNTLSPFKSWPDKFWGTENFFTDDFFPFRKRWMPAVNIKENKLEFNIEVAAPGLDKVDFKVTVDNGILVISVEKEPRAKEKGENYTRKEFGYHSFERSFTLPENVDADNVEAKYNNGVLNLRLKKTRVQKIAAKRIAIK